MLGRRSSSVDLEKNRPPFTPPILPNQPNSWSAGMFPAEPTPSSSLPAHLQQQYHLNNSNAAAQQPNWINQVQQYQQQQLYPQPYFQNASVPSQPTWINQAQQQQQQQPQPGLYLKAGSVSSEQLSSNPSSAHSSNLSLSSELQSTSGGQISISDGNSKTNIVDGNQNNSAEPSYFGWKSPLEWAQELGINVIPPTPPITFDKKPELLKSKSNINAYDPVLFDIMQLVPKQIAKQMAIVDLSYFKKIEKEEFLSLAWNGTEKWKKAPNIATFIQRFNNLTLWVSHEILGSNHVRRRAEKVEHFIEIAKACADVNNFNGLKSILAGLQCTPVFRLKKTWALVGRAKHIFDSLTDLMSTDSNSEKYRKKLGKIKLPCIPYLGIHLSDITFSVEAKGKAVDRSASSKNVEIILEELMKFQQSIYDFEQIPPAMKFLSSPKFIAEMEPFFEEENYQLSLQLEPKDGTDEVTSHSATTSPAKTHPNRGIFVRKNSKQSDVDESGLTDGDYFPPGSGTPRTNKILLYDDNDTFSETDESESESEGEEDAERQKRAHSHSNSSSSSGHSSRHHTNPSQDVNNVHSNGQEPNGFVPREFSEDLMVKDGYLVKKDLTIDFNKAKIRNWKKFYVMLRSGCLVFFKDKSIHSISQNSIYRVDVTEESFISVATDYKKRKNVLRFLPQKGTEMLLEAESEADMKSWLALIEAAISRKRNPKRDLMSF